MKLWLALTIALGLIIAIRRLLPVVARMRARARTLRPDSPVALEPRTPWLAIRTTNSRGVAAALALENVEPANWRLGMAAIGEEASNKIFIMPPVLGWTLVAGFGLPTPVGRRFVDKSTPLFEHLGAMFDEVQFFQGDSLIDHYAWARVVDGKVIRSFAIGDEGLIWNKGKLTREERALGLKLFELRGIQVGSAATAVGDLFAYPAEAHVLKLASNWSLDPSRLGMIETVTGLGLLGTAPRTWKSERQ